MSEIKFEEAAQKLIYSTDGLSQENAFKTAEIYLEKMFREGIKHQNNQNDWREIKSEDDLPKEEKQYLFYRKDGKGMDVQDFLPRHLEFDWYWEFFEKYSAWRELPEPFKRFEN